MCRLVYTVRVYFTFARGRAHIFYMIATVGRYNVLIVSPDTGQDTQKELRRTQNWQK